MGGGQEKAEATSGPTCRPSIASGAAMRRKPLARGSLRLCQSERGATRPLGGTVPSLSSACQGYN
jgi:hypothetical protein